MKSVSLSELFIEPLNETIASIEVNGITADSREVTEGFLFFALSGMHTDGAHYYKQAIEKGACAICSEKPLDNSSIPVILVKNAREVLSYAAAQFYEQPGQKLKMIGVTGTDGKSSTVYFTHQLLELAQQKSGFFSTVAYQDADKVIPNNFRQSTLEALELNKILDSMVKNGKEYAVIETTSHGLSPRTARLLHIPFRLGAFTNLSHEHLEFHGSFEQYKSDKANLFRNLKDLPGGPSPLLVLNHSDPASEYFKNEARLPVLWYRIGRPPLNSENAQSLWADKIEVGPQGIQCTLHFAEEQSTVQIPLQGRFNIENLMASLLLVSHCLDVSPLSLCPLLKKITGVQGRMKMVDEGQDFTVIVDYAHTPGSFERILPDIRKDTKAKLILVFGSGGERDPGKRPLQGSLAAHYGDIIILCNEDPRLENEMSIIEDIAKGVISEKPNIELYKIPDRTKAVEKAISCASSGDTVLLLGKGHEQCIIHAWGKEPYDEESTARKALSLLKKEISE